MTTISFFDSISSPNKFNNFIENYFYLPIISEKLGNKKIRVIKKSEKEIILSSPINPRASWLLTLVKVMSYFTLILPFVVLTMKIISRTLIKQTFVTQENTSFRKSKYHEAINAEWSKYNKPNEIENFNHLIAGVFRDITGQNPSLPDGYLANIISEFENDSDIYVVPNRYFKESDYRKKMKAHQLDTQDGIDELAEDLSIGFNSNKKLVIVRLNSQHFRHTLLGVFKANGEYVLIDSLLTAFDINKITQQLNDKKITVGNNQILSFQGKHINTHLQKDGTHCMKFATLYAYVIAKTRDPNAFIYVHRAFQTGQLQTFEDYRNIDLSPCSFEKYCDTSSIAKDRYLSFMNSWAYRSQGFKVDTWKQIQLKEVLANRAKIAEETAPTSEFAIFDSSKKLPTLFPIRVKDGDFFTTTPSDNHVTKSKTTDHYSTFLNEASTFETASKTHQIAVLAFSEGRVHLFHLEKGTKLFVKTYQESKKAFREVFIYAA